MHLFTTAASSRLPPLLLGFLLCLLLATPAIAVSGTNDLPETPLLTPSDTPSADLALDVRLDHLRWLEDKSDEAFALAQQTYAVDRRRHVAATYGSFLIQGPNAGAPSGLSDLGLSLCLQAVEAGDAEAAQILGWAMLEGRDTRQDVKKGLAYLEAAAAAGNLHACQSLAVAYLHGVGVAEDDIEAERWARRAALQGFTFASFVLGSRFESGNDTRAPDLERAAALYLFAAQHGSKRATQELARLSDAGQPDGRRAHLILRLWMASLGYEFQSSVVKAAVAAAAAELLDDPAVLHARAWLHTTGGFGQRNPKLAFQLAARAAAAGSLDGRSLHAQHLIDGFGTPKDPATGIAELRALVELNHPDAIAQLGYYHYWGNQKKSGLPKDATLARQYSLQAAALGHYFGQTNAATCYEFGIGTEVDYAAAAYHYRAAALAGSRLADERYARLFDHLKISP